MRNTQIGTAQPVPTSRAKSAVPQVVALDSWRALSGEIKRIRQNLRREFGLAMDGNERLFGAALNEAEALACQTPYPHLLYPLLAEEKAAGVQRWAARQRLVRQSSRRLLKAA